MDTYRVVKDYVDRVDRNEVDATRVGKPIVLPSSYQGSPRNMQQLYQDAMANVRRYGRPDLFITATGSGKWDEIEKNLLPGQTWSDRPDLIARVCDKKFTEMIAAIKKGLLGVVVYYCYTIEYQKRGMPHVHLLVKFTKADEVRTPKHIDTIISAQIPADNTTPYYRWCTTSLIHGPCGAEYNNYPACCLDKDGNRVTCTKGFPKEFCEATTVGNDSYALYARPPGITAHTGRHEVDNRWVVPHNEALLYLMDGAHVNVECTATIKACKYIFKYTHKGADKGILADEGKIKAAEIILAVPAYKT